MSDKEAKSAAAVIDVASMFNGAVIGNNATIQIGNQNQHHVITNLSLMGDKKALAAELRNHGVSEDDVVALDLAIGADATVPAIPGQLGTSVKGWMKRMLEKAIDASWNIELGVAGGLLTSALQRYYGI